MNDNVIAAILGLVEGITEYLPVSSTGHLILFGDALGFTGDKAAAFDVIIQLGAILSVVILYWRRFVSLLKPPYTIESALRPGIDGSAGVMKLGIATLPALVVGALFHHAIKEALFKPFPVAIALATGAIIILVIEKRNPSGGTLDLESLTIKQAFLIGCVQCFAMWPGMSRSASAIIGGMLMGLNRKAAAEFSFLAAVPVLAAAAAKDLLDVYKILSPRDFTLLGIGFVVSFLTALVTVKWFIGIVSRHTLAPFAYYRLVVAALVLLMML